MLLTKEILIGIYSGSLSQQLNPPSAPLFLSGTPEEDQVILTWNEPTSTGSSPITDYVVQYSLNGGANWFTFVDGVTTNVSSVVVGLVNGISYLFRVAAVNAAGQSEFSNIAGPHIPYATDLSITRNSGIGFEESPEYVEIINNSVVSIPLSGWYMLSHVSPPACNIGSTPDIFKFPNTSNAIINPGQTVRIYSGTGSDGPLYNNPPTSYWWGNISFIWNDEGDIVHLYNPLSALASVFATGKCIEYTLVPKDGLLFGYNFADVQGTAQSSVTATTVSEVTASSMTRLAGLNSNTTTVNAWGSQAYNSTNSIQTAINNNDCFTFSASSTKTMILSGARGPVLDRTSTAPSSAALIYNFTNIWSSPSDYNIISNYRVAANSIEDYSEFIDNYLAAIPITVPPSTAIYMRFVPYGSSSTAGSIKIFNFVTTTGDGIDFALYGTLSS